MVSIKAYLSTIPVALAEALLDQDGGRVAASVLVAILLERVESDTAAETELLVVGRVESDTAAET